MSHFAKLDADNVVIFVTVGRDEDDENELTARTGDVYKRTSYNTRGGVHQLGGTPFRKNYAGLGYTYDPQRDAFVPPQPHPSWTLNEDTCLWQAPTAMPNIGMWTWDETIQSWIEITGA